MAKWGQVGVILAIILSIGCIILGTMYYQENEKRIALEKYLEEIQNEKRDLELNLKEKENTVEQLNQAIKEIQEQTDSQLKEKETLITDLTQELNSVKEETGTLKSEYLKLKDLRQLLENTVKQVKAEKDKLQQRLNELEKENETLSAKLGGLGINKAQLNLEKIVVQQEANWYGEILAVDNEYGYAVIDVGMKENLTENVLLGIFRDGENIGEGEVVKLYENTAVIKITKQNKEILEGDLIRDIALKEKENRDF